MKSTQPNPWLSLLEPLSYYGFFAFLVLLLALVVSFASELHHNHSLEQAWWWTVAQDPIPAITLVVIFFVSLWQAPRALQTIKRVCKLGAHHLNNLIYLINGVPRDQLLGPPDE